MMSIIIIKLEKASIVGSLMRVLDPLVLFFGGVRWVGVVRNNYQLIISWGITHCDQFCVESMNVNCG